MIDIHLITFFSIDCVYTFAMGTRLEMTALLKKQASENCAGHFSTSHSSPHFFFK